MQHLARFEHDFHYNVPSHSLIEIAKYLDTTITERRCFQSRRDGP